MFIILSAELFYNKPTVLGEGPLWDHRRQQLGLIDIVGKKVLFLSASGQLVNEITLPKMPGCMVPSSDHTIVIAAENSLFLLDRETEQLCLLAEYPEITDPLRFNDGKCDAYGRLLVGTMFADQSLAGAKQAGTLYRIENQKLSPILHDQTIPNGIAWSEDNNKLYHIDTPTGTVVQYTYDSSGSLSSGKPCVSVPKEEGSPDGMCIDTEGNLWIAHWGGYKVARYCPDTGEKLDEVPIPAENVSCCVFGGKDLSTLFITTAQNNAGEGGEVYQCHTKYKGTLPFHYQK